MESVDGNTSALVISVRRKLKLTQEEFAHLVGVTVSTVNRWENGHVEPSRLARKAMQRLARRVGVIGADAE